MMNLRIYKIIISQFLALILCAPIISMGQTSGATWNYPVRPGTEEWKELSSFSERLNAFNIPDSILTTIATENLVKTCLDYPWWILITSRDNIQAGYDYLKSVFNGFRELENRKDAGKELLKVYERMDAKKRLELKTSIEKGILSYQFVFIEVLLSQPTILNSLSKQDLTQLLGVAISVFQDKNNPEINYSLLSLSSTGLVLGRILEKKQNLEFSDIKNEFLQCENFIKEGITDNRKMLICIYSIAELYYKKLLP